jgi:hypothetical protein
MFRTECKKFYNLLREEEEEKKTYWIRNKQQQKVLNGVESNI